MRQKNISFRFAFECFVCIVAVVAMSFAFGSLVSSCSASSIDRKVVVTIPQHPWESHSNDVRLWYYLKWTYGHEVRSLYVPPEERVVKINVPMGETVFVCAFPLGEMRPFGAVVTPFDSASSIALGQSSGYVASILIDVDRDATKGINYNALQGVMDEVGREFLSGGGRGDVLGTLALDKVRFLRDVINGELSKSSVVFLNPFEVPEFAVPNGVWVSESVLGLCFEVSDMTMPALRLNEGVHRFLNQIIDRELVVVVDERGNTFRYVRQALV